MSLEALSYNDYTSLITNMFSAYVYGEAAFLWSTYVNF